MDKNTSTVLIFAILLVYTFLVQYIDVILNAIVAIALAGGIAISVRFVVSLRS